MSCELDPHHCRCIVDLARTYASLSNDTEARINSEKTLGCLVDPEESNYNKDLGNYRHERWEAFTRPNTNVRYRR